jgi:hypothetical protein
MGQEIHEHLQRFGPEMHPLPGPAQGIRLQVQLTLSKGIAHLCLASIRCGRILTKGVVQSNRKFKQNFRKFSENFQDIPGGWA